MNWIVMLAAGALTAAAWAYHAGEVSDAREAGHKAGAAEVKGRWDEADRKANEVADQANAANREKERNDGKRVIFAQSGRSQVVARDNLLVAGMRAERDGLRADLASALATASRCDVPGDTAEARADRAAAINSVFDTMERAGQRIAGEASGHGADSLMYQDSWPE